MVALLGDAPGVTVYSDPPGYPPVARDPFGGLVGDWLTSVEKDPPHRDRVAVRVVPALMDLWRAGILSFAGQHQQTDFQPGLRFAKARRPNARD